VNGETSEARKIEPHTMAWSKNVATYFGYFCTYNSHMSA